MPPCSSRPPCASKDCLECLILADNQGLRFLVRYVHRVVATGILLQSVRTVFSLSGWVGLAEAPDPHARPYMILLRHRYASETVTCFGDAGAQKGILLVEGFRAHGEAPTSHVEAVGRLVSRLPQCLEVCSTSGRGEPADGASASSNSFPQVCAFSPLQPDA